MDLLKRVNDGVNQKQIERLEKKVKIYANAVGYLSQYVPEEAMKHLHEYYQRERLLDLIHEDEEETRNVQ